MNAQHKSGWFKLILLIVPIFTLIGWGIWLVNRGPFKLAIQEAKVTPLPKDAFFRNAIEPNKKGIKLVAYIGYEGRAPDWWGVRLNSAARVHFTNKDDNYTSVGYYPGAVFDKSRGQYIIFYEGEIPKNPNFLKQATCHVSVRLRTQQEPSEQLASAKVSIPAHKLN